MADNHPAERGDDASVKGPGASGGGPGGAGVGAAKPTFPFPDEHGDELDGVEAVHDYDALRLSSDYDRHGELADEWDDLLHLDNRSGAAEWRHGDHVHGDDEAGAFGAAVYTTTMAPWAWICQLIATQRDGSRFISTGWLLSGTAVISAGGAVYGANAGWTKEIEVIPGLEGSARPWGSLKTSEFQAPQGWVERERPGFDYACLTLPGRGFEGLGHFGLALFAAGGLSRRLLNAAGYAPDGVPATQSFEAGRVASDKDRRLELAPGFHASPGSPLWTRKWRDGRYQRFVCGMMGSSGRREQAVRVNAAVVANLKGWAGSPADGTAEPGPDGRPQD